VKTWLLDAIDQIALGEYLASSPLSCGTRFGLIAVDNSVEFMLIAYVEAFKQLVGGHKAGGISKNEWRQIKRNFEDLLAKVCSLEPNLGQHQHDINRFHVLRNGLYHSGAPTTVSRSRVLEYSGLARDVLDILFSISFTEAEWDAYVSKVGETLVSGKSAANIRRSVSFELADDIVRFSTSDQPSAAKSVALSLYGFGVLVGKQPESQDLLRSVALSGYPMTRKVLSARVSDLRREGWIRKDRFQITAKGLRNLQKEYILS
jgi:hypothetical protein